MKVYLVGWDWPTLYIVKLAKNLVYQSTPHDLSAMPVRAATQTSNKKDFPYSMSVYRHICVF